MFLMEKGFESHLVDEICEPKNTYGYTKYRGEQR